MYRPRNDRGADAPDSENHARGRTPQYANMITTARKWREIAEKESLSIRELMIRVTGKRRFVGTPAKIAQDMIDFVEAKGADGFIMFPHISPSGLEPFVDRVIPLLQERGVFRTDYTESTLRGHLGLPAQQPSLPPEWPIILVHRQENLARTG
jgi:alkanesulfonate monooxygenase SsuD/methylene tetrahydromethanopterin reductase-like flavin-dependent oxidoreductase (luciferase family)